MKYTQTAHKYRIYKLFLVVFLLGTPAIGLAAPDVSPFDAVIQTTQGRSVHVRVVPLQKIGEADILSKPTLISGNTSSYDRKLPFVDYSVRKPQEFKKYLDRQVSQEAQESGIQNLSKITTQQAVLMALRITNKNLRYEDTMAESNPLYNRALDDTVSATPLDDIVMREKRGVCRQFAAVFEKVFSHIVTQSRSKTLARVVVDEVVSYDLNHAYNVVYVPTHNHGSLVIDVAFIEPIQRAHPLTLASADASDRTHDGVFAELIQGGRLSLSEASKEEYLWRLADDTRTSPLVQKESRAELMTVYAKRALDDLGNMEDERDPMIDQKIATLLTTSDTTLSIKALDERYDRMKRVAGEIQKLRAYTIALHE